MKIKAIVFDIGSVLVTDKNYKSSKKNPGIHAEVAKSLKLSLDFYFDSIDSAYSKSIEGKISPTELLKIISYNLQTPKEKLKKLYEKIYKKYFKINKELYRRSLELKKQGYQISILSDQWPLSEKVMVKKEFYKNFSPVIISDRVGLRKPNIKIYKLLKKKLNLKSSQILFVDNQRWNLIPAEKLGMKTILFKNNKQFFSDLKKRFEI